MEEYTPKTEQSSFDIKNYLLKLIAYWYLFAISIIIAFTINSFNNRFAIANYVSSVYIFVSCSYSAFYKLQR